MQFSSILTTVLLAQHSIAQNFNAKEIPTPVCRGQEIHYSCSKLSGTAAFKNKCRAGQVAVSCRVIPSKSPGASSVTSVTAASHHLVARDGGITTIIVTCVSALLSGVVMGLLQRCCRSNDDEERSYREGFRTGATANQICQLMYMAGPTPGRPLVPSISSKSFASPSHQLLSSASDRDFGSFKGSGKDLGSYPGSKSDLGLFPGSNKDVGSFSGSNRDLGSFTGSNRDLGSFTGSNRDFGSFTGSSKQDTKKSQ